MSLNNSENRCCLCGINISTKKTSVMEIKRVKRTICLGCKKMKGILSLEQLRGRLTKYFHECLLKDKKLSTLYLLDVIVQNTYEVKFYFERKNEQ